MITISAPDPLSDPLVGQLLPAALNAGAGTKTYPVSGGFAYPHIPAGTFGGTFTLDQPASAFNVDAPPVLIADGKFYVVRVVSDGAIQPTPNADGQVNAANLVAIYQVCTHLGCLVPYIVSEKRFICPCHGSTFERDSQYVRGPAPRNLDQFPVLVVNDTVIVNTGRRIAGHEHA
ncbi:MAG: ubiquinol-cytochrome c reductase iron-sulfur subunit [Kouleothrix sp.]|nr:ubiquinol-cytochrome c reductase iron-sulfur subunit [Kouleothrix sp.]